MIDPVALSLGVLRSKARAKQARPFEHRDVRSVGLVELTRLGDVLCALPTIRALARSIPAARFHFFVAVEWAPITTELMPEVHVHALEASDSILGLVQASAKVREIRPDLSISLSPSKRNALLCLSSGSRMKAGYLSYANTLTPFLAEYLIEGFGIILPGHVTYGRENIYRRPAKVIEALGLEGPDFDSPRDLLAVGAAVSDFKEDKDSYIVLHPFSGWDPRNWPLDSYVALAEAIAGELELRVVFLCAPKDTDRLSRTASRLRGHPSIEFVADDDLLAAARVIKGAGAFVGNDSGPLHLAAAFGVPVVGLYGAAPPELTAPPGAQGSMLYHRVECSPCDQRFCRMPESSCMSRIGVREVIVALEKALKGCETPADG